MKILKYELKHAAANNEIQTFAIREILSVGEQNGKLFIWIKVDNQSTPITDRIYVAFTGEELPSSIGKFIGTVQIKQLVLHVFENPFF